MNSIDMKVMKIIQIKTGPNLDTTGEVAGGGGGGGKKVTIQHYTK